MHNKTLHTLLGVSTILVTAAAAQAQTYTEPYRPQYHFTPAQNWMNDPNGLVYANGVFHLFFQYNPSSNNDGNLSWGHATSPDLLHWTQQPVALTYEQNAAGVTTQEFFSGSAVYDSNNTSGFGTATNPPLVAIYASEYPVDQIRPNGQVIRAGTQAQSIAYSTDGGTTWTQYAGDPVIPNPPSPYEAQYTNFRDPKVFWYQPEKKWVMVATLAAIHKLVLYSSRNLVNWTFMSTFGPYNATNGAWECPDLFELPVDGNTANEKWVMMVGVNPGSVTAGSGTQYFVGDFDGHKFTADADQIYNRKPPAGSTIYQNFEDPSFSAIGWTATGDFAGAGPVKGSLSGQQEVSGYLGKRLVNTFLDGDASEGTITSPAFTITQPYIDFMIGGGYWPYNAVVAGTSSDTEVGANLLVGGKVVQNATGSNTETVEWRNWDVSGYIGKKAQIQLVDHNQGGFGHLDFDEVAFSATPKVEANWVDFGPDFYAANSWNNVPNGARVLTAWMNNWYYAGGIPVSPWRGADTIPRELSLTAIDGKATLTQQPVTTLPSIEGASLYTVTSPIPVSGLKRLPLGSAGAQTADITVTFQPGTAGQFGLHVHTGSNGDDTIVGYDSKTRSVFVDRTSSGQTTFSSVFPGRYSAPLAPDANGLIKLRILVDWSSVEVFAGDDGQAQITSQVFPAPSSNGVSLYATGGTAIVQSMTLKPVNSVWTSN